MANGSDYRKKFAEKVAQLTKKHYIGTQNEEDSRIRQSESNDNRTRRHPVDLLAAMSNQKPCTIDEYNAIVNLLFEKGLLKKIPITIPLQDLHLLDSNLVQFHKSFALWYSIIDEHSVDIFHV